MANHESVNGGTKSPEGGMLLELKEGRKTVKVRRPPHLLVRGRRKGCGGEVLSELTS